MSSSETSQKILRNERRFKKMKFNFRKIASVLASVVMIGSTIGIAAAANYPAPFVAGGSADVALVYGSNAATSDLAAAVDVGGNLQYWLASQTATGGAASGATTTGGDSYQLQKTSTKFHLGNGILDVVSGSVTDSNLPVLLADGVYTDDNNNEFDYTQSMTLSNSSLTFFEDNDYKADTPVIGIKIASGAQVLNYTLDFTDNPAWADLETTDLTFMGKTYFVLDAVTNTSLTLLDSAESANVAEGETKTLTIGDKTYDVKINFVESNKVKLDINGEITNQIAAAGTYKLKDGTYVGVKEINFNSKDTGVSNVEFSIGKGKLVLTDGQEVEMNDDSINGLSVAFTNTATKLQKVKIIWTADDDLFVAPDSEVTMPGFNAVKLSFAGMTFPAMEAIAVNPDSDTSFVLKNFPLKTSTEDINLLYYGGTNFTYIGKDATHQLITGVTSITFDGTVDDYFVASWTDGSDAESYLMKATSFITENAVNKTTIQYKKDGSWTDAKKDAVINDVVSIGNVDLTVGAINKNLKTVVLTDTAGKFNTLYSKEGMKIYLPYLGVSGAGAINFTQNGTSLQVANSSTFSLILSGEDKSGNKAAGSNITLTLGADASGDTSVIAVSPQNGATFTEIGSSNVFENYIYSALATEMKWDKNADQYKVTFTYHGDESFANVFLSAPSATITPGTEVSSVVTELGTVTVKDTDVSSVSGKNLIVIGGSCINTVAAKILGSATPICGAAFTEKTGIGASQALIKVVKNPYLSADTTKIAMLVAGYEAEDTTKAIKYVTTVKPSTSEGTIKLSTSTTTASVVTA
jgi:hypothetical protein